jgi:hypothetical protein
MVISFRSFFDVNKIGEESRARNIYASGQNFKMEEDMTPNSNRDTISLRLFSFAQSTFFVALLTAMVFANPVWVRDYSFGRYDFGNSILKTTDNCYLVLGGTSLDPTTGADDFQPTQYPTLETKVLLSKIDSIGNELWRKTFDVDSGGFGYDVKQCADGGYVIAGSCAHKAFLVKVGHDGAELWAHYYTTTDSVLYTPSVEVKPDKGFLLVGTVSRAMGKTQVVSIATDSAGNENDRKFFSRSLSKNRGYSIRKITDTTYLIAGETWFNAADTTIEGTSDVFLVCINDKNELLWKKEMEITEATLPNFGRTICLTSSGTIAIGGYQANPNQNGSYIISVDVNGNQKWHIRYTVGEKGFSITESVDKNNMYLAGSGGLVPQSGFIKKVDRDGKEQWHLNLQDNKLPVTKNVVLRSIVPTNDSGFVAVGWAPDSANYGTNIVIIKGDKNGRIMPTPQLIYPVDNAFAARYEVSFTWQGNSQIPGFYEFQSQSPAGVATDNLDTVIDGEQFIFSPRSTKEWRMRMVSRANRFPSEWSSWNTCKTLTSAPTLSLPQHNSVTTTSPKLMWFGVSDNTIGYSLQVSTDSTFASFTINDTFAERSATRNSTLLEYELSDLTLNTKYFWRVRFRFASGYEPWSIVWAFRVTQQTVPGAIALLFPPNADTVKAGSVRFIWQKSRSDADRYLLQIAGDSLFTLPAFIDSAITDTIAEWKDVEDKHAYWWRARAHNAMGWGAWSVKNIFAIKLTTSIAKPVERPKKFSFSVSIRTGSIRYGLPKAEHVLIQVFGINGQMQSELINTSQDAGYYSLSIPRGKLASGSYLVVFKAGDFSRKKMTFLMK